MNPFSGFMQAVTGLVPGCGDNNVNIGKGIQGLPVNDDTILSANENTGSFLAWVQGFMQNAAGADADGDSGFNFQPSDLDLDLPVPRSIAGPGWPTQKNHSRKISWLPTH